MDNKEISSLLEQMESAIKDIRSKATNDFMIKLQNDEILLRDEIKDRVVNMVLRLLEEKNVMILPRNIHKTILNRLIQQLSNAQPADRKQTIVRLSHLLTGCNSIVYDESISDLLKNLEASEHMMYVMNTIQCLAYLGRQADYRLRKHIDKIISLIENNHDNKSLEFCAQAYEAFVQRYPDAIEPHIPLIVDFCLNYIAYNPDEENLMEIDEGNVNCEEVRQSAAKCLETVISTRTKLDKEFYKHLLVTLISLLNECKENVKSDIYHAYIALLRITRSNDDLTNPPDAKDTIQLLRVQMLPRIVPHLQKSMMEKSVKTRSYCFLLLRELLNTLADELSDSIKDLIPGIQYSLEDENQRVKIDALNFLSRILPTYTKVLDRQHIRDLVALLTGSVSNPYYKIASEALLVLQHMSKAIQLLDSGESQQLHLQIYDCIHLKFQSEEIDIEEKKNAIACMGQIIANMPDDEINANILPIFLEHLKNEATRSSAVEALTTIAALPVDLTSILDETVDLLCTFLNNSQRALKLDSLILLDKLINKNIQNKDHKWKEAINSILPLLNCKDLHVTQLSLVLLTSTAKCQSKALDPTFENLWLKIQDMVRSPLLQGDTWNCIVDLLKALIRAEMPNFDYLKCFKMLKDIPRITQIHKQTLVSIAKCAASIFESETEAIDFAVGLLEDIQRNATDTQTFSFILLTIGEIGRRYNLSTVDTLPQTINSCFGSSSEGIKNSFKSFLNEFEPKIQCSHSLKESILSLVQNQEIKKMHISSREDHSDWFDDVDAKYKSKEDYMKSLANSRVNNHYQRASRDLKKLECYKDSTKKIIIDGMLNDFYILLTYIDWLEEYFDRGCGTKYESTDNDETDGPPSKRKRMSPKKKTELRSLPDESNIVEKYIKRLCNEYGEFKCRGGYSEAGCKFNHKINPYRSNEKMKEFRMWQLDHTIEFTEIIEKIGSNVNDSIGKSITCAKHSEVATKQPIMKYFQELFTSDNIRLVHIVCHDTETHGIPLSADLLCEKCDEFVKTNALLEELKSKMAGSSSSKD